MKIPLADSEDRFMSDRNFVKVSLNDLKGYSKELADKILDSRGRPDAIIYVERGGMVIGRLLSDTLSVKAVAGINASYYLGVNKRANSVSVGEVPKIRKGSGYLLLVDDVADTGKTLKKVADELSDAEGSEVVTCTVFYKPRSMIKPDFYAKEIDNDKWIVFEYEENEFASLKG